MPDSVPQTSSGYRERDANQQRDATPRSTSTLVHMLCTIGAGVVFDAAAFQEAACWRRYNFVSTAMHLLILGATGPCGLLLIQEALEADHTVVAYVRSPQKLTEPIKSNPAVTIVEGQLTDRSALQQALSGVDAVLSALGPPVRSGITYPLNTPLAQAYTLLIELMKEKEIKRLIALGTPSMKDEHDKFSLVFRTLVTGVATFAHGAYKDVVAIGEVIRNQGDALSWTIVRVPFLVDNPSKEIIAGYIGDGKVTIKLSRAGFAAFCLKQLQSDDWANKAPLVSLP
ncbi:hypothetical protein NM688_g1254 [Phlebia brevispora]|uniref:Uncharacterized protein n=1 Tax=Phlebia brevispora TaxID=194682 RepID=A0ACC1TCC4_9APHY|nr:hypothetical protein NM688_g1254 [Phlebia brevispora]